MLLRLFKGTGPAVVFMIIVTFLSVWASAFINLRNHFSLYFDLDPMPLYGAMSEIIGTKPLPGIIFTLFLVSFMALLMVNLNTSLFFINERTFLPALIYILLSGLFPQYQLLNPAIVGALFLMLAIRRIMDGYRIQSTAYSFFDAGFLIGTGSLFYANLIWFGLIIFIGIVLIRTVNVKEIGISMIGLVAPFILTFGVYYVLGRDLKSLLALIYYNLFERPGSYAFSRLTVITIIFFGLGLVAAIGYLFSVINSKKIKARKTFYILGWILFISAGVYIFMASSVEIIWIIGIPASYLLTHYFVFSRRKFIPEVFLSLYFILILLIQVLYLR